MSDVGAKAATKSGGLQRLAECNLTNPERDCHQVLVKKLHLALPIQRSHLKSDEGIPILKIRSWFDFFLRNSCIHILHGLRKPHPSRETSILSAFWRHFQRLHPKHRIFDEVSKGNICLSRALPLVVHGDEGRGRRHCAHFVCSFHSLLGMGFSKQKKSRVWAKMECNFAGHTYLNRFLIATLRKKDYSDENTERWENLMEAVATDAGSMWQTGVSDSSSGLIYWGIVVGIVGDWPFLHKSATFSRSFNNIQKRVSIKNPPSGICHLCRSGQVGIEFEQIGTRRPEWLRTVFTQDPFLTPSVFVQQLLHSPGAEPSLWCFDWFHTMHLGVLRNYLGSVLALLSEQEPYGSVDVRFESLNRSYKSWCRSNPRKSYYGKVSKEAIGWDTTKVFPSGQWHKGSLSTSLMAFVEERFQGESFDDELLKLAAEACDAIQRCSRTLYRSPVWLDPAVSGMCAEMGFKFLRRYSQMATLAKSKGRCLFVFQPKIHVLHHFLVDMWGSHQQGVFALSPLSTSCQPSEDFIGRPSRLARRVTARSPVLHRIMSRYLQSSYHHFVRAGYLFRPMGWICWKNIYHFSAPISKKEKSFWSNHICPRSF